MDAPSTSSEDTMLRSSVLPLEEDVGDHGAENKLRQRLSSPTPSSDSVWRTVLAPQVSRELGICPHVS